MAPHTDRGVKSVQLSRRAFLRGLALGGGATLLGACGAQPAATPPTSAATTAPAATNAPAPTTAAAATNVPAVTSAPAVAAAAKLVVMAGKNVFSDEELAAFSAANAGITVERIDEDPTRLKAMLTGGNPPDLIRVGGGQVPLLVIQDRLLDLTPYFSASSLLKTDDLAPPVAYFKHDGTRVGQGALYGMHMDWSPDLGMFASTAAFEEAGLALPDPAKALSYADLAELAPKLTKREGDRVLRMGYHIEHDWIDGYVLRRMVEENKSVFSADHRSATIAGSPEVAELLTYIYNLAKEDVIWSPLNPSPGFAGEDFTKGLGGIVTYGYWFSGMIRGAADSPIFDKTVMLPGATWTGTRANPSIGGAGLVISKTTANPDAAWKLFEYHMGGEPAAERAKSGWGVPALRSLMPLMPQETAFDKQTYQVVMDELQFADFVLDINPYMDSAVWGKSWKANLEQALRGELRIEDAIANLDSDVNAAIADGLAAAGM